MLVNYSSANSSLDLVPSLCFNSTVSFSIIIALSVCRLVILVPISISILYLGHQQWRQHHSLKTASHSDIFTYNVAVMELIWSLGTILSFLEIFSKFKDVVSVLSVFYTIIFYGECGFHILTCVDRYLAIVHPVKYRELRNTRGVTIRNISIFCVWLVSVLLTSISYSCTTLSIMLFFSCSAVSLIVVSFCSLSVLRALFGPGKVTGGRNRGHIDRSKQRAFFTVMAIMGVLCLFFLGFLVSSTLIMSQMLCPDVTFVVHASLMWFSLPSSLILTVIYLYKTGKLPCVG